MSRLGDLARALVEARPLPLLAGACVVQVAVAAAVAHGSTHNYVLWYSGGDATEYWTASWGLAHHLIGQAHISYGVPALYAWVPPLTGATMISGLPVIIGVQLLVLVPLAALLVWAIGDLLFGRLFAWWALALWIAGPLLLLWGFNSSYAPEFRDLFLAPHWYGLTNMADMPSTVAVLAATWAVLRAVARHSADDAVLAGLFAGLAIGLKPANGFYLAAIAVLLVARWSTRVVVAWALGFLPPLLTLALWKKKGLGELPVFAYRRTREALGSSTVAAINNPYVRFDLSHLEGELRDLANAFWSLRLLEFLVLAGLVGAFRRSPLKAAFLAVWFAGFAILKGSSTLASVTSLNYWRYIEPGIPAFVLLAASTVFLVPRRARPFAPPHEPGALPGGRWTVLGLVAVFGLVPLVLIAVTPPASSARYAWDPARGNSAPISSALQATATPVGGTVKLAWHGVDTGSTRAHYIVYRSASAATCSIPGGGGKECDLQMTTVGLTRDTTYVDHPPAGRHWYRIGLAADYTGTVNGSDLMLVGPATAVSTAR